ncbi:transcriptional regulator with XRE-family HTH domain [Rhodococcus sp. 27YEA15]|uniref:helix-turn-helix domain-containing protein n=1 Tax=Rhodococcus sp. 27YEA15 TaxID=3156259 RepID=UPI003C7D6CBD
MVDSFKDRLNALYPTAPPRLTNAQVVESLSRMGCRISTPYLSQLRSGVRTNPSEQVILALAEYFKVGPDYFFGPTPRQDPELASAEDRSVVEEFHDAELRSLTRKAADLSTESQDLLSSIAEKLRASEGLPPVPPDCSTYTAPVVRD